MSSSIKSATDGKELALETYDLSTQLQGKSNRKNNLMDGGLFAAGATSSTIVGGVFTAGLGGKIFKNGDSKAAKDGIKAAQVLAVASTVTENVSKKQENNNTASIANVESSLSDVTNLHSEIEKGRELENTETPEMAEAPQTQENVETTTTAENKENEDKKDKDKKDVK